MTTPPLADRPPPIEQPTRGDETIRVLLLLDRPVLAQVVALALSHGGYMTHAVATVAEAVSALETWRPHVAVVDMDAGGIAFLERAGAKPEPSATGVRVPVIALTRRGDLKTTLEAFERGVDDLLTGPLSPQELLARTRAVLRRTYGSLRPLSPVIRRGELEIDIVNRCVRTGDHVLHLTQVEQSLLYLLAANDGRVLTRDEILDHLWGADYVAESNIVDQHVRSLRAKLQDDWREPRYIATIAGQGYRFVPTSTDERGRPTGYPPDAVSREERGGGDPGG